MFDQYILTDMAKEAQSARLIENRVWHLRTKGTLELTINSEIAKSVKWLPQEAVEQDRLVQNRKQNPI